jgi:glycosyltransferase involved in cell wall biosynthesis
MLNSQNDPRKNVEAALSAWPYFLEKYPDSVLVLAGEDFSREGPLAKQQRFAQLESVQFIGSIPAQSVSSWMHSLDVFLHPSLEESFGMVLVEAMQGSAVVIAGSSSGAVPEVVDNAGYLVDVTDPRQIAAALVHLRDEPGLADEFRRRASDRIVEFGLPVIASQYLSVMDEIVQRGPSGRKASHRVRGRKISTRYEG